MAKFIILFFLLTIISAIVSCDNARNERTEMAETTEEETPKEEAPVSAKASYKSRLLVNARQAGGLSTFAAALESVDMPELENKTAVTIFAPTDEAFEQMPPEKLKELMQQDNNDQLAYFLKNHIVSNKVSTDSMTNGMELTSLNDKILVITRGMDRIRVNNALLIEPDKKEGPVMIYKIDKVLTENETQELE